MAAGVNIVSVDWTVDMAEAGQTQEPNITGGFPRSVCFAVQRFIHARHCAVKALATLGINLGRRF